MGTISDFKIETYSISFGGSDSYLLTYSNTYTTNPSITATAESSAASLDENVNVYIENITLSSVTIRTSSSNFTGNVNVQIIGT
jgi:hypothetical protein